MPGVRITQVRSAVSRPKDQGRTLRALGLHRIRDSVEHEDRPEIRGMARKVAHLVVVTELDGQPARPSVHRRRAGAAGGSKSA
jgi:large subunit ribosomal protein L30